MTTYAAVWCVVVVDSRVIEKMRDERMDGRWQTKRRTADRLLHTALLGGVELRAPRSNFPSLDTMHACSLHEQAPLLHCQRLERSDCVTYKTAERNQKAPGWCRVCTRTIAVSILS